jgi:hypothetical protein
MRVMSLSFSETVPDGNPAFLRLSSSLGTSFPAQTSPIGRLAQAAIGCQRASLPPNQPHLEGSISVTLRIRSDTNPCSLWGIVTCARPQPRLLRSPLPRHQQDVCLVQLWVPRSGECRVVNRRAYDALGGTTERKCGGNVTYNWRATGAYPFIGPATCQIWFWRLRESRLQQRAAPNTAVSHTEMSKVWPVAVKVSR